MSDTNTCQAGTHASRTNHGFDPCASRSLSLSGHEALHLRAPVKKQRPGVQGRTLSQSQSDAASGLNARSTSCCPGCRRTQPLSGLGTSPQVSEANWAFERCRAQCRNTGANLTRSVWGGGVAHAGGPSATTVRPLLPLGDLSAYAGC